MSLARVAIHSTQFPEAVRRDLLESLRSRRINHKFHYDSFKQTQKWLALHQAYSPSRTDPECEAIYQHSFAATAELLAQSSVHLVGLGCGGGQKDTALLRTLRDCGCDLIYSPCDVSVAMVLVARQTALSLLNDDQCFPLVCDLATAQDLPEMLLTPNLSATSKKHRSAQKRLFTFFGMMPNFEPELILPKLAALVQPGDHLLVSANLAPGNDYAAGVERILPLYDNELTRDWLMAFLIDLGIEQTDGRLNIKVEDIGNSVPLKRIAANFQFVRDRTLEIDGERFVMASGQSIGLFFSYRHTSALMRTLLNQHDLPVLHQWKTPSEEEGVFLVTKQTRDHRRPAPPV